MDLINNFVVFAIKRYLLIVTAIERYGVIGKLIY